MFWGLILSPGKKYTQVIKESFHISHAALDTTSIHSNDDVQVLLTFDSRNYLLCTLNKNHSLQVSLDLNFQKGEKMSLAVNGPGHVHLTGYMIEDDLDLDEEDDEEIDNEELLAELKAGNEGKNAKRKILDKKGGTAAKKIKASPKIGDLLDESLKSDDSKDSDVNFSALNGTNEEDSDDGSEDLEEEDDDEDDDHEDDDDEDDDDEEDEEEGNESDDEEDDEEDDDEDGDEEQEVEVKKANNQTKKKEKENIGKLEKKPKQQQNKEADKIPVDKTQNKQSDQKKTIEGGVLVEDIIVGNGQPAKKGKMVQVYYEGRLKSNNKTFDSTKKGPGFKFRLGAQEVIKGWDVGVVGMRVGGKRRITCPPHMAYGSKGSPPVIPPNSTLVFEVELKGVH